MNPIIKPQSCDQKISKNIHSNDKTNGITHKKPEKPEKPHKNSTTKFLEPPKPPQKFLDFKGKSLRKDNKVKQKTIESFFSSSQKPSENLVRSILFNSEKETNTQGTNNQGQSQPTNISTNNMFNNNDKLKMSALQKALFYKRLEGLYAKTVEMIPIFKNFMTFLQEKLAEELKTTYPDQEFLKKMMKFCLLRFIFENPCESWHKIYKPLCCKDILNVKNTRCIRGWLMGFFKKQKERANTFNSESRWRNYNENSSDFNSELFDETSKESLSNREKLNNFQEIQEIAQENKWKFNTLLIRGRQGIGKSTAVFSAAIDLDYEIIEINNSSKRSEKALKKIYEATQSQGIVSSHFKDFMLKVRF